MFVPSSCVTPVFTFQSHHYDYSKKKGPAEENLIAQEVLKRAFIDLYKR